MKSLIITMLFLFAFTSFAARPMKQVRTLSCKANSFSWIYVTTSQANFSYYDAKTNSIENHVQSLKGLKLSKTVDALTKETVIYDSTRVNGFHIRVTRPKGSTGRYSGKMSIVFDSGNELVRRDHTGASSTISELHDLDLECDQIN